MVTPDERNSPLRHITLRGAQRELFIAQENVADQEKSAEVTHRKQRGGMISGLDAANADAQVAATKSQIPVFQQQEQQTIYDIRRPCSASSPNVHGERT